jgi:hypothetical protein
MHQHKYKIYLHRQNELFRWIEEAGYYRRCKCGLVEFADSCEGRVGGTWRPIKVQSRRRKNERKTA